MAAAAAGGGIHGRHMCGCSPPTAWLMMLGIGKLSCNRVCARVGLTCGCGDLGVQGGRQGVGRSLMIGCCLGSMS